MPVISRDVLLKLADMPTLIPLSESQYIRAFNREAAAILTERQVEFSRFTLSHADSAAEEMLLIRHSTVTVLNRLAQRIFNAYGVNLAFRPGEFWRGKIAGTDTLVGPDGTIRLLGLSARNVFKNERLLRDPTFLHELRDWQLTLNTRTSPFHGDMVAERGVMFDPENPNLTGYDDLLGFLEFKSLHAELKQGLTKLRGALRRGDARATAEALGHVTGTYDILSLISGRTMQVLERAIELVNSGKLKLELEPATDRAIAVLRMTFAHEGRSVDLAIRLPLIGISATDPRARALTLDQLTRTTTMVFKAGGQVAAIYEDLGHVRAGDLEKSALIKRIDHAQARLNPADLVKP